MLLIHILAICSFFCSRQLKYLLIFLQWALLALFSFVWSRSVLVYSLAISFILHLSHSVSLYISFSLPLLLSPYNPPFYVSILPSISPSLSLPLALSFYLSICLPLSLNSDFWMHVYILYFFCSGCLYLQLPLIFLSSLRCHIRQYLATSFLSFTPFSAMSSTLRPHISFSFRIYGYHSSSFHLCFFPLPLFLALSTYLALSLGITLPVSPSPHLFL